MYGRFTTTVSLRGWGLDASGAGAGSSAAGAAVTAKGAAAASARAAISRFRMTCSPLLGQLAHHLVRGLHDLGGELVRALRRDHAGDLVDHVHVRGLEEALLNRAE